jgi:hypothetical protein
LKFPFHYVLGGEVRQEDDRPLGASRRVSPRHGSNPDIDDCSMPGKCPQILLTARILRQLQFHWQGPVQNFRFGPSERVLGASAPEFYTPPGVEGDNP